MNFYNEMMGANDGVRTHYQRYDDWLRATPPERIARKRAEADLAFHRVGITFAVYGEEAGKKRLIPFGIIPRIIPAAEWKSLQSGLRHGLTRVIERMGRSYSFEAIRVKLLLAPKKQGMVTSYRSIRRRKMEEPAMARHMCLTTNGEDDYEIVQVPERKLATFGVDIAKLEEWIEEDLTGQQRLPGVG